MANLCGILERGAEWERLRVARDCQLRYDYERLSTSAKPHRYLSPRKQRDLDRGGLGQRGNISLSVSGPPVGVDQPDLRQFWTILQRCRSP